MEIVKAVGLKKYYITDTYEVRALDGVTFFAEAGEFVAIVGTSGSGKTTLLNMLGGLDEPTEGKIYIRGQRFQGMNREAKTIFRRRNVGFVFQQFNLVPVLNVYEIREKLEQMPAALSGGQQQRAAIARALCMRPAIILADEPTGNLDSRSSMEVASLLKTCVWQFNQTVIMVTHDEEMAQMADRILPMEDGRIREGC